MKQSYSDDEIIKGLLTNDNQIYHWVYHHYCGRTIAIVVSNNGTREDGKDIFQNTVLKVVEKLKKGEYKKEQKLKAYFSGVAANLWRNERRKKHRQVTDRLEKKEYLLTDKSSDAIIQIIKTDNEINRMFFILNKMDEICKKILQLHYLKNKKC